MLIYHAARRYIKGAMISSLRKRGYQVRDLAQGDPDGFAAAKTVKESRYYGLWEAPCPLFSPWMSHPDFQKLYDGVEKHTIVPPERCYILAAFAHHARMVDGDFAECGVFRGGTSLLLTRILAGSGKGLYLFDSFKGLPKIDPTRDVGFKEGLFAADSVESVKNLLKDYGDKLYIRQGWIPDTFAGLEDRKYAFVHVDVDLYQSTRDCLNYFYSRMQPMGVLVFDEYGFAEARGEKDAVDEFFEDKPEKPIVLPTGQAFVLKAPSKA